MANDESELIFREQTIRPQAAAELRLATWQLQAAMRLGQLAKEPGLYYLCFRATDEGGRILNVRKDGSIE